MFMKYNYLKIVFISLAMLVLWPGFTGAQKLMAANAAQGDMNLYLYQPVELVVDKTTNATKTVYVESEVIELNSYDGGQTFRTPQSISLPEGQLFVIASETPKLYTKDENGDINPDAVTPTNAGATISTNTLYRTDAKSGNFVYEVSSGKLTFTKPLYFALCVKGSNKEIESVHEMFTTDDHTYTLEKVEIPQDLKFGLTTTPDKDLSLTVSSISVNYDNILNIYEGRYYADPYHSFKGTITSVRGTDSFHAEKFATTFETQDFPSTLYFAVLGKNSKVTDYYEFKNYPAENETAQEGYEKYNYVIDPMPLKGKNIDSDVRYIVTRFKPVIGKMPFSTTPITPEEVNELGKEYTFNYKNSACQPLQFKENYYGKIWMKADDSTPNTFILYFETLELRPPYVDSDYYDENQPLLDKTVYNTTVNAHPLQNATKPIYHDNDDVTDQSVIINGDEHQLVKMEGRRALVGAGMHINRLSGGSLANVIDVNTGLENVVDEDLDNCADFVNIATVQLATAPLLSVKDTKHYYARGTQCGFNIVGASGTSVLSLSVVEALSIAFYRDGELMCVKEVNTNEGQGVGLNLITVSSGDGTYDLTAEAPCVFDEIAIWTASGLKLNVGNDFKVNYAWVGKEKEITLGTHGIEKYNAEHPGANLHVARKSTTWDAANLMDTGFTGNEEDSENLINTLNLLTGGVGWAEVCMDEDGHDDEQVFKKGSRINFVLEGGSVLNLGLFTGNTITLYKRVVSNPDRKRKVDYEMIKAYPLSATVLELDVVQIKGKNVVSMVAPVDFSGARLTVSGGLVNLGVQNIYYASVTPPPTVDHKCDLRLPTTIYLSKEETRYIRRSKVKDEKGNPVEVEELVKTVVSYPSSYVPKWNRNAAETLEWSFAKDENGNDIVPLNSNATVNPSTGEIVGIDVVNAPGVYKLHYRNPEPGHEHCYGDLNIIVKESLSIADDAELASIIGKGLLATEKDFELSYDTHDVALGGGGLHIGQSRLSNSPAVLDGSLMSAAVLPISITLGQNELLCGIKLKRGKLGGKGKKMRLGFIIEAPSSFLGADVLNFWNIRCYNNDSEDKAALFDNQLSLNNTGVGLTLIGKDKVVKQRVSVVAPAQTQEFDEYQLWFSGAVDVALDEIKIYGAFYEYIDDDNTEFSQWLPDGAEVICETAKVFPIKVSTASVGTEIARLSNLVDDDNKLDSKISWGTGAEVGSGTSLLVDMGRTITTTQKVGIYTENIPYTLDANVGSWMTVNTYRSTGMENGTVGRFEGLLERENATGAPQHAPQRNLQPVETFRLQVKRTAEEEIQDKNNAIDQVTNWKVVGADVAGPGDRSGSFFRPSQDFDLMEIQIGEVVGALGVNNYYAITTCAATDDVVKYVYLDEAEIDVSVEPAQLLLITAKGKAALKAIGIDTDDRYITYPEEGKPIYTVSQVSENEARSTKIADADNEAIRSQVLAVISRPENVVWTSDYQLAGNDETILAKMEELSNDSDVEKKGMALYMGNADKKVMVNQKRLDDGSNIVGFFNANGSLDTQNFSADAVCWYTKKGQENASALNVTSGSVAIDPVMPPAYGLRYKYRTERHTVPFAENAYVNTVSSVLDEEGKLLAAQVPLDRDKTFVPDYTGTSQMSKTMKVGNLTHHHLDCDFTFKRPNVDEKILNNYDIYMMLGFRNNLTGEQEDPNSDYYIIPKTTWVKDDGSKRNNNNYVITAEKVNPLAEVSPQASVRNTFFVPVGTSLETEDEVNEAYKNAPNGCKGEFWPYRVKTVVDEDTKVETKTVVPEYNTETRKVEIVDEAGKKSTVEVEEKVMRVQADNTPDRRSTYIEKMNFELYNTNGKYQWYYNGHMAYTENGDYIDISDYDDDDESENEALLLNPSYYDVESFIRADDENHIYAEGEDYCDYGKIFETVSFEEEENPFGQVGEEASNVNNKAVIAEFDNDGLPTFVLTPIYIYYREPEAHVDNGVDSDDVNGLIPIMSDKESAPQSKASRRADEETIDPDNMSGDFIVKRGGAGIYKVEEAPTIVSGLDELQGNRTAVISGKGYLEIVGTTNAEVYNVQGILVARGGGRHHLEPGVYIVVTPDQTTKHSVL